MCVCVCVHGCVRVRVCVCVCVCVCVVNVHLRVLLDVLASTHKKESFSLEKIRLVLGCDLPQ